MLIALVGCFSIKMATEFPVHILTNTIVSVCILIWGKKFVSSFGSIVLVIVLQNLHLGSALLWRILAKKNSSEEVLILCGNNKPLSVCLKPGTSEPLMGVIKSTSAFWIQREYWPCKGFDFQAVSIAFSFFSLAILFNFRAFSVFFIFPSNSFYSLAPFATDCEPFSFPCFKASCRIHSSDKFKYRKRPIVDVW